MPEITLETKIVAPIERCFDLARSIDLHKLSLSHTKEEAIAGVTTGLITLGEEVTWRAKHFGVWQTLTSRITNYERPTYFRDSMVRGIFSSFDHDHYFTQTLDVTTMTDVFAWCSPLGPLGVVADSLVVSRYLKNLLRGRNELIKQVAESDRWKELLQDLH